MTTPISSIGTTNPYMMSYLNDPYFLMALNSPYSNINGVSFGGAESAASAQTDNSTAVQPVTQAQPKEKKSNAGKILTGIAVIGAAALTVAAYRKGGSGKLFERIGNGYTKMFNGVKARFVPDKPTLLEMNGKQVVSIPGKHNVIHNTSELSKIGESFTLEDNFSALFTNGKIKEGNQIANIQLDLDGGKKAIWSRVGGKSPKITIIGKNGKKIKGTNELAKVNEAINKILNGETSGLADNISIKDILLKNTNEGTGLLTRVHYKPDTSSSNLLTPKVSSHVSKYFSIDHKTISALRYDSSAFNSAIESVKEGHLDKFKVLTSQVKKDSNTFIVDRNGEILKIITDNGTLKAGTNDFKEFCINNKKLCDEITSNKKDWVPLSRQLV